MGFPWPIKEAFMNYVEGDQEHHPYVVGLKFGIEVKLSEFVCKELCVSVECCECLVIPLWKTKLETSRLWLYLYLLI